MIVKQHWLAEPNQSNSWDQTMPVTTVTRSDEGERITMTIPFSTIFFRAVMAEIKIRIRIVAETTYEKLTNSAMRDKKAQFWINHDKPSSDARKHSPAFYD